MADVSSFDESIPSGNSEIRKGDDLLRKHWTDLKNAWEEDHYFQDGSTASGGQHKPGSSRISYGSGPAINAGDEGRLFYDVDDNQLTVQGSSATTVVTTGRARAKAELSSDSDIDGNGLIAFDNELYDNSDMFSTSGNDGKDFVIPTTGEYQMLWQVEWSGLTTDDVILNIEKDTGNVEIGRISTSGDGDTRPQRQQVSAVAQIDSGESVQCRVTGVGGTQTLAGSNDPGVYFAIHQI